MCRYSKREEVGCPKIVKGVRPFTRNYHLSFYQSKYTTPFKKKLHSHTPKETQIILKGR